NGYKKHTVEEYKTFVGSGTTNLISRAMGHDAPVNEQMNVLDDYSKEYNKNILVKTCPFKGCPELLMALEEKGIKLSVLSNKPDKATRFLIEKCFPSINFTLVRGQLPDVPIKPDPKAALQIAEAMGLLPEEIAFIGDSPEDFETGKNAGMLSINALWGYRTGEQLLSAGAEILCEKPEDVLTTVLKYV
ncbi:MAG: HAD-superfamily hydrolase, subfamily variant 1, partial [Clostridia bacterium]|nr:HAD-superfamily hydrolase, subfamily variant 1 [Clostridia bacterium]